MVMGCCADDTGCCFGSRQRLVVFGVVFWVRLSYAFEWSVSVDSCLERVIGSLPSILQVKCHSRCVCLLCLVTIMCAVCAGRCAIPAVCMQRLLLTSQLSWLLWDGCYVRRVHVPCGHSYERPARVCAAMAGLGPQLPGVRHRQGLEGTIQQLGTGSVY